MQDAAIFQEVAAYRRLEQVHLAFEKAAQELERARAASLCIPNCGKCCQRMTPYIWDIEGRYIRGSIMGNGHMGHNMDMAETWLLDKIKGVNSYGTPAGKMSPETWTSLQKEVHIVMNSPCPFLDEEKRCVLYSSRPISCRGFGVTRLPGADCLRPLGIGEGPLRRAYYTGPGGLKLRQKVNDLVASLEQPIWRVNWFMPTLLYLLCRPDKYKILVDNNQIAAAKLVISPASPSILWQEQLEAIWTRAAKTYSPN